MKRILSGRCVYVGEKTIENKAGGTSVSFGRTGFAFYDESHPNKKYDFRPDGLNFTHFVDYKDLFFPRS